MKPLEEKVPRGPAGRLAGLHELHNFPDGFLGSVSCYFTVQGFWSPSSTPHKGTPPPRLGFLNSEAGIQQFLGTEQLELKR